MSSEQGSFRGVARRQIAWQSWTPSQTPPRAVITIVHGFGEHLGRYEYVAQQLTGAGYQVYGLDHHGHGRSEGKPGRVSLSAAVADLDQLIVTVVRERHPGTANFLLGHSMGGAVALRYGISHQDRLSGMVVSAPLAAVNEGAGMQRVAKLLGILLPGAPASKVDPRLVSRDPEVVAAYKADPLNFHGAISAHVAREFILHTESLPTDVKRITIPTLLIWGSDDKLCPPEGAQMVAREIGSADLTTKAYPGLFHEIMNEPERDTVIADVLAWLAEHDPAADAPAAMDPATDDAVAADPPADTSA